MKKKDHKETTKVEKDKVVDLNTDNQKSAEDVEAVAYEIEEQELPV